MSAQFGRDHCKIAVVKILQTIGWHSINSTPLEVLTDLMVQYIRQISKTTNDYTTEFGNTEANLDHLGLAFHELGINLSDLSEYVTYVNFCPAAQPVPKFPLPKEDNLNFLKPGSQEVVTRPVHIHEHMPPMFPLLEESEIKAEEHDAVTNDATDENINAPQFKKPAEVLPEFRRPKREDEGGRPTREISSVMMTTSGFLSPAREGKLPEAKAPLPPPPPPPPVEPPPPPAPPVSTGGSLAHSASFSEAAIKKRIEKKEKKINKELFKPFTEEKLMKKHTSMKDVVKMKKKAAVTAAAVASNHQPNLATPNLLPHVPLPFFQPPRLSEIKVSPVPPQKIFRETPDKTLAAAKAKTEKFNTTITPIPIKTNSPMSQMTIQQVEKLFNEPDRKKINILRKISNVKENKAKKELKQNAIVDEGTEIVNKINLSSDITIEPIPMRKGGNSPNIYFDDGSPPGTPRTPDIMLHHPHHHQQHHPSPPVQKEKRKRKDPKPKIKKPRKSQHRPMFTESELMDIIVNRPKTPEAHHHMRTQLPPHMGIPSMPFPFLANFGGPGLIPSQLTTPMFPFSHLGGIPNFGKNPYFPSHLPPQMDVGAPLPTNKVKETKEVKIPPPVVEVKPPPPAPQPKPVDVLPQPAPPPRLPTPTPPPPSSPPTPSIQQQPIQVPETSSSTSIITPRPKTPVPLEIVPKKNKEHKKEKKDKIKKKNKKDKVKDKEEKKKIKDLKKEGKEKVKREKKIKKKDKEKLEKEKELSDNPLIPKILLKVNSPSPRPETPERKLIIKPIVKKDENDDVPQVHDKKREPSPGGLAKISALVTGPPKPKNTLSPVPPLEEPPPAPTTPRTPGRPRLHPLKPKSTPKPPKKVEQPQQQLQQVFKKIDEHGNEVWICPSCGQQDDGRPMIGCDGCDAWYHWVCVGIQVPPDENENWYCKPCLARKNEDFQSDKKRKRKRKEKKEH